MGKTLDPCLDLPNNLGMPTTQANGAAIRAIRERSDLTIKDLVVALSDEGMAIHPDYLRNIELGHKQPSERLLGAIARALRVQKIAIIGPPKEAEPRRPAQRPAAGRSRRAA